MKRKWLVPGAVAVAVVAVVAVASTRQAEAVGPAITVYKSPSCGCCTGWVEHLEADGFDVSVVEQADLRAVMARYGVPNALAACHTAVVDGYVVEGHVPAAVIRRFLADPPAGAVGIAVPGMPVGSPGMEGPNPQPYDVFAFDEQGGAELYQSVDPR